MVNTNLCQHNKKRKKIEMRYSKSTQSNLDKSAGVKKFEAIKRSKNQI